MKSDEPIRAYTINTSQSLYKLRCRENAQIKHGFILPFVCCEVQPRAVPLPVGETG